MKKASAEEALPAGLAKVLKRLHYPLGLCHIAKVVASLSPPRREVFQPRLRFPILTLEERLLTPALGYVFNKKWLEPYESIVSILRKFKTANALPGYALARLMNPRVDPYEGVAPRLEAIELERLRRTLVCLQKPACCAAARASASALQRVIPLLSPMHRV